MSDEPRKRPVQLHRRQEWYRIERAAVADAAEIYIYDEIGRWGVTAQDFVGELQEVTAPAINLHLNTPGGDVYDGIAIYNALKNHPATVRVWIEALAASIGTVIAAAGDEVNIAPHAKMMIHDAAGFMDVWGFYNPEALDRVLGNVTALRDRLEATSDNVAAIYAERTDTDAATWRAAMQAETWYTDQEAVDAGLADRIARSNDDEADRLASRMVARLDASRFRHGREVAALQESISEEQPPESEPPAELDDTTDESNRIRRSRAVDRVLDGFGI